MGTMELPEGVVLTFRRGMVARTRDPAKKVIARELEKVAARVVVDEADAVADEREGGITNAKIN